MSVFRHLLPLEHSKMTRTFVGLESYHSRAPAAVAKAVKDGALDSIF
jgi:hypothetical protein